MYIIIKTSKGLTEGKFIAFVTVKNENFVIFSSNRGNIYKISVHQYEYFFINESTKNIDYSKSTKGIIDNYLLLEQLGQGASAFVYKALDLNNEQNVVAYKKINEKNLVYTLFKNEADIFLRLPGKNKNVIEYLGASYTLSSVEVKICGIALEYLPLGDVYTFMKKLTPSDNDIGNEPKDYLKPLSKFLTKHFSNELFHGLQYLHSHNIVHRDIKAANLLMKNEQNKLIIKISDFGFATALTPGQRLHDKIGTPNFMAPEIFQFNYNHSIDIWAAGVCLFLFAYGFHPFEDERLTLNGTRNNILSLHYTFPTNLTAISSPRAQQKAQEYSHMNDLLNRIFMYEKYRISITEILNHPYFLK